MPGWRTVWITSEVDPGIGIFSGHVEEVTAAAISVGEEEWNDERGDVEETGEEGAASNTSKISAEETFDRSVEWSLSLEVPFATQTGDDVVI